MGEIRSFFALGVFAVLPVLIFAMLAAVGGPEPGLRPEESPMLQEGQRTPEPAAEALVPVERPLPEAAEEGASAGLDSQWSISLLRAGVGEVLPLDAYLLGVLAAEMPASFQPEALKAQAVAARTDTFYRMEAQVHPGGACCDDPACCKAYLSPEERKARWGEDWEENQEKLRRAVAETDGLVLTWQGEAIFAAFHAASPGSTENSEDVWLSALPYLRSVESPETAAEVPDFYASVSFSYSELRRCLEGAYPELELGPEGADWLTEPVYTRSGRLRSVCVGGRTLSGSELRRLLGLRSTAVSWSCSPEGVRFETAGYGHGVGMSQYGAEVMARSGADCREILEHYYSGVALEQLSPPEAG